MAKKKEKPIQIVPPGMKEWFMEHAYPEGTTPIAEVREIDPNRPGLDEFEAIMRGDDDLDEPANDSAPEEESAAKPKAHLKLVVSNGSKPKP